MPINFSKNNKCTAFVWEEMTCVNYQKDPFERRYSICAFRQDFNICKHSSNVGLDDIIDDIDCIPKDGWMDE